MSAKKDNEAKGMYYEAVEVGNTCFVLFCQYYTF